MSAMISIPAASIHLNVDILDHDGVATDQAELSDVKAEFQMVGITQGYKNDYILFLTDHHGSSNTELSVSLLNANPMAIIGQTKQTSFRFRIAIPQLKHHRFFSGKQHIKP